MKKEIIIAICLFAVIFSLIFVSAQEKQEQTDETGSFDEIKKAEKELIEKENLLKKEVVIPENLKLIAKLVFGLNENDKLDFSLFIILIAIWLGLFSIIAMMLKFLPFLNEGFQRFIGAIVITCLVAVSGAIKQSAVFYLSFLDIFHIAEKYGILKFILALFIAIIFFYGVNIVLGKMHSSAKLVEAEVAGEKAGFGFKLLENFSKIWGKE